jgi:Transglycosylase-like domain
LRKVLAAALCAIVAAAPAVAFAATDDNETNTPNTSQPRAHQHAQLRQAARHQMRTALERAKQKRAEAKRAAAPAASPALEAIAACESGGNPRAIGGGGAFRGKYQFDYGTWASVGGSGDPAAAPEGEQDRRAAMLLARSGSSPWPVCG